MPICVITLSGSVTIGPVFFQICTRHRAADPIEIGSNLAADIAAIKIVKPGMRELLERRGKFSLFEPRADVRHLAVEQKGLFEIRRPFPSPAASPQLAAPGCG